jgi:carbon monoxide dehydrogenase subunit G
MVSAPADVVWRVLTDHEGMSSWSPGVRVTLERAGDPRTGGVGAVRLVRAGGMRIRELVTAIEPERRLTYRCLGGLPLRDYGGDVVLTADGGRTEVSWAISARSRSRVLKLVLMGYARTFVAALARAAEREYRLRGQAGDGVRDLSSRHVGSRA